MPNRPPPKMPLYQPSSLEANPVPEAIAARPCLGWALPVVDAGVLQGPSGSAVPGGDTGGSRGGLGGLGGPGLIGERDSFGIDRIGGGRDPFVPGDRTWWKLPSLPQPGTADSCIVVSDWLVQLRPIMGDISDRSAEWWDRVMRVAESTYRTWQAAAPLHKSQIQCLPPEDLNSHRFARLESRALSMLLESIPECIKQDMVVSRNMTCVNAVYRILITYQPGGLEERQRLIKSLAEPGQAATAKEGAEMLRKWHRWLARSQGLGINTPDAAILLAGIDKLASALIQAHPQLSFRCSVARTQAQLDFNPSEEAVISYARHLQAEFEVLAVSGSEDAVPPKKPKLQKMEGDNGGQGEKGKSKNEGKGGKGEGAGTDASKQGKEGAKGGGKPCGFYLTPKGCSKGRNCTFMHNYGKAKGEGRCFNCGSSEHKQQTCTRPQGTNTDKGKEQDKGAKPKGEGKTKPTDPPDASSALNSVNAGNPLSTTSAAGGGVVKTPGGVSSAQGSKTNDSGGSNVAQAQALVLEEAQKLLKSLRLASLRVDNGRCPSPERAPEREPEYPQVAAASAEADSHEVYVPQVAVRRARAPTGLLDGGATHPLRTALAGEFERASPTRVQLAIGSQEMRINAVGTVITEEAVSPICPLGLMVERLGCRVVWEGSECRVIHPRKGPINVWLEDNCPVVSEHTCLELIRELEGRNAQGMLRALNLRALQLGVSLDGAQAEEGPCAWGSEKRLMSWIQDKFQGLPEWLKLRTLPPVCQLPPEVDANVGLNRRTRRTIERARHVVVHLCSGRTKAVDFKLGGDIAVLNIDILYNRNLLDDHLYGWLAVLCASGKVKAIIGGPPCSSISPLRERGQGDDGDGGPRPIRGRSEELRFGLPGISVKELSMVKDHSVIVMRFLALHHIADEVTAEGCLFALENPQDPLTYWPPEWTHSEIPSLWAWPEMLALLQKEGNDTGDDKSFLVGQPLDERIAQSKTWAKWAPKLTWHIGRAILSWINTSPDDRRDSMHADLVGIRALSVQDKAFKEHCENGHVVFRRDCQVCLQASMRGHMHMRQLHQSVNALTLSLDLIGPWVPGKDHLLRQPARHILVATLAVPMYKDGKPIPLEKDPGEGGEGVGDQGADVEPDPGAGVGFELEDVRGEDGNGEEGEMSQEDRQAVAQRLERKWLEKARNLQAPVKVKELLFCEPLSSKRSSEVLKAVQRIHARILMMNLFVRRVHSDAGREFNNRSFQSWCLSRDIYQTFSNPSDPKSNGRVESAVGKVKAGVRGLLQSAPGLGREVWPSAVRQFGEQKLRQTLKDLGAEAPRRPLPPFGTPVMVHNRAWSRKTPHDPKAISGIVVCPAAQVPNCSVIQLPDGRFYLAPVVYQCVKKPVQFVGQITDGPLPPPPERRITGKRPDAKNELAVRGESGDEGFYEPSFSGEMEGERVFGSGGELETEEVDLEGVFGSGGEESSERLLPSDPEIKNLWCELQKCAACEEPRVEKSGCCSLCGVWRGKQYTLEESENRARELLSDPGRISRTDVNRLLSMSMCTWQPKTRACDREISNPTTSGWTLGFYVYGSRLGVTRETLKRPQLTLVLNRYMKQEAPEERWAALRVTCNFESGPHKDRNEPESRNVVVPVSWFKGGKIWIGDASKEGFPHLTKEVKGKSVEGYLDGGADRVCVFNPRIPHAVEASEGARRVIVGYTPRSLKKLPESEILYLQSLEFPLPNLNRIEPEAKGGEGQEQTLSGSTTGKTWKESPQEEVGEEDVEAGVSPGGDGSNLAWEIDEGVCIGEDECLEEMHEQYVALRKIEMDARKYLDEELERAAEQGFIACSEHILNLKEWVQELEAWVIKRDASKRLRDSLLTVPEACVMRARLCQLGVTHEETPEVSVGSEWLPLSGLPVENPEGEPDNQFENLNLKPPGPKASEALPAAPLQTVSVSHREVLECVEEWRPSIGEEIESVFERHKALQRTSKEEVDSWISQGKVVEYLPSKALFNRKGGTGRHKTRIVACGNFARAGIGSEDHGATYAGGIDSTTLRIQLSHCSHKKSKDRSWTTGALDIRTAFLLAPLEQNNRILVLRPPKVLISAGIVPAQELWYATGAIYGLREAPAAWSSYRDSQLPDIQIYHEEACLKLVKSKVDQNLWYLKPAGSPEAEPIALLGVYVDDLIATGPRAVLGSLFCAIQNRWETSRPQFASDEGGLLFCGLEIHDSGNHLHIHQKKYLADLLSRYPNVTGGASQPGLKEPEDHALGDKATPDLARVRLAQKLAGELLWIATKTRPDLVFVTSRIGQMVTRNVEFAIQLAYNALRYLRSTAGYEIIYGNMQDNSVDVGPLQDRTSALEVYADASFAPGNDRSQTGIILVWNQVPITWLSMRQPCASLSTAESELQASIDALALTEGFLPLVQELESRPVRTFLYNDNQGAVTVMKIPQGSWRTRHLRLKAAWFFEQLESDKYSVFHLPGKYMLGDLCTKTLQANRIKELLHMMQIVDKAEGESAAVIKRLEAISNTSSDCGREVNSEGVGSNVHEASGGGLVAVGLKLVVAAACLKNVEAKLVVTVEEQTQAGGMAWLYGLLACVGVVLFCCGVKCGREGCCRQRSESVEVPVEGPVIQSMRAEDETDAEDHWSVIADPTEGRADGHERDNNRGLRRRTRRGPNMPHPAPESLGLPESTWENSPTRSRDIAAPGPLDPRLPDLPSSSGLRRTPQGPFNVPYPDPEGPRYPNPDDTLPDARRERGLGFRSTLLRKSFL